MAEFSFKPEINFDFTSGVTEVEGCNYIVTTEADMLVIKNLPEGASVKVYNVAGMILANATATADIMKVSVPDGVYVVKINNDVLKVKK